MRYGISIVFALTLLYCVFLDVIPWGRDKLPSVYCAYRNSGASDICILVKMASLVQVLCPNGRRQNVKVTPNTKLLQVCKHKGIAQYYPSVQLIENIMHFTGWKQT